LIPNSPSLLTSTLLACTRARPWGSHATCARTSTASWCPPCKAIAPVFEKLAHDNPAVHMVKVDVDANPESAEAAGVQGVPTFELYLSGQLKEKFSGAAVDKLNKMVAKATSG